MEQNNENEKINTDTSKFRQSFNAFLWEIIKFAIIAVVVFVPIRMYIASPFIVSGSSMDTTLATGHYLIVDEISYRFNEPVRGEVIVFRHPDNPSSFLIKRIVGLPGETLIIRNGNVFVSKNNSAEIKLNEPYVKFKKYDNLEVKLDNDEYFVMVDNRVASSDSRAWGPLEEEWIVGRALIRLFPLNKIDIWPGRFLQNEGEESLINLESQ